MPSLVKNILEIFKKNKNAQAMSAYMFGNIFYKAFPLIMMPILTGMLSTADYGLANTYASWVSIIACLNGFGLGNAIRVAYVDYRNNLNQYMSSAMMMSFAQFITVSAIGLVILKIFFGNVPFLVGVCCAIHSYMTCIVNAYIQKFMMEVKYTKKVLLQTLPNVAIGLLSVLFIYLMSDNKYLGRIFAFVVVYVIVGGILMIYTFLKGRMFFNFEYWKYGFKFSVPLVFSGLALVILSSFDTTMLTTMVGASEAGIYSVTYSVGTAVLVLTSSFESVWIPWFTERMNKQKYGEINKGFQVYLIVGAALITGAMLCLPEVFKLFANKSYWGGLLLLPPIVLATFFTFLYSIAVNYEYYCKKTKIVAMNSTIAAVLNVLLNAIVIPKFGAQGAAYTTVASYVFVFIIHTLYVKRLNSKIFPLGMYCIPISLAIVGVVISYIFINMWVVRWLVAAFYVFVIGLITLKSKGKVFGN